MARIRQSLLSIFVLIAILIPAGQEALASGPTVHARVGDRASDFVSDPGLKDLLKRTQQTWYGYGIAWPDSTLVPNLLGGADAHSPEFLSNYISYIEDNCGFDPITLTSGDSHCSRRTAHFMGALTHVITDYRFDRYFLMANAYPCGFLNDPTGASPGGGQFFTDAIFDTAVSCREGSLACRSGTPDGIRPNAPCIQPGLVPDCCGQPFPFGCINPIDLARCFTQPCLLADGVTTILKNTYPDEEQVTLSNAQSAIDVHMDVIAGQPALSLPSQRAIEELCTWPFANYQHSIGGIEDSARVAADFINKSWELLTDPRSNAIPFAFTVFEHPPQIKSPSNICSNHPKEYIVMDAGPLGRFDFASWIELRSGVSRFEMESYFDSARGLWVRRIGALVNGTIEVLEGDIIADARAVNISGQWKPLADGVVDFRLEGDRIGILTASGDLLVKEGSILSEWIPAASGVSAFQLEGDRVGYLIKRGKKLAVTEGSIGSGEVIVGKGKIRQFQLEGDRIGVLVKKGKKMSLRLTEGFLESKPVRLEKLLPKAVRKQGGGIGYFQLEDNRIGALLDEELMVITGPLSSGWVSLDAPVSDFLLRGDNLTAVERADGLYVTQSSAGGWNRRTDVGDGRLGLFDMVDKNDAALDRLAYVDEFGSFRIGKAVDGSPCAEAFPKQGGVRQIQFDRYVAPDGPSNGHRLGVLVGDTLYVRFTDRYWN